MAYTSPPLAPRTPPTPPPKKNGIQRTTVVVSIAFEGRHISILDILRLKYPITNQTDDNFYVFYLTYGLVSSEKCSAIMKRTSLITMT